MFTSRQLDDFEYAVLTEICNFSATRNFGLGINEEYILHNIGYRDVGGRFIQILQDLFDENLIFYKTKYNNRYWLPTKKGREYMDHMSKMYNVSKGIN